MRASPLSEIHISLYQMASVSHFFITPFPPLRHCARASQAPPPATSTAAPELSAAVSPSVPKALSEIQNSSVIACLRAKDGMLAMEAACAALKGGISVLEVMLSTPDALMVMQGLLLENPLSIIGVGSVLNVDDARNAMDAGAKFLTSPGTVIVLRAHEAGAKIVKVYPTTILGGCKYISALKRPFPHIPMVASQGISIDSIGQYINAGTSAVILSDAIFDNDAMKQRDFDTISRLAGLATSNAALAGKKL